MAFLISDALSWPITWLAGTFSAVYMIVRYYATREFNYFSDQGIPGPKPLPFVGNMWGLWKANLPQYDENLVKTYGKVFGYFDGPQPKLWITDPELIKSIFVKDFDHFVDRRSLDLRSKVMRKMLIMMRGQEWKDVRSSITPAFTSGKIKRMSNIIKDCVDQLSAQLICMARHDQKMDAKKTFSAFSMDVIARCAFGLKIDNLGDVEDPFTRHAQTVVDSPTRRKPIILLPFMYPKLFSLLGEKMFMTEAFQFFIGTMQNLVHDRSLSDQKFHDFAEIASETISEINKKDGDKVVPMWTKEEVDEIVVAQSVVFLLAGFDTTSTTLTNAVFLLAKNPDVQQKLYSFVMDKIDDYTEINHDMVQELPYVEQVINEVLRMYPPGLRIERMCTKDITYENPKIHIKKGVMITVPTYALHRSEEYYPDPSRFDPDRWSPENRVNRNPYAYMPFGVGPRNCVGMRFALEELKITLCCLIKQFRFFAVDETLETLQFSNGFQTVLQPMDAVIGVELRQ